MSQMITNKEHSGTKGESAWERGFIIMGKMVNNNRVATNRKRGDWYWSRCIVWTVDVAVGVVVGDESDAAGRRWRRHLMSLMSAAETTHPYRQRGGGSREGGREHMIICEHVARLHRLLWISHTHNHLTQQRTTFIKPKRTFKTSQKQGHKTVLRKTASLGRRRLGRWIWQSSSTWKAQYS